MQSYQGVQDHYIQLVKSLQKDTFLVFLSLFLLRNLGKNRKETEDNLWEIVGDGHVNSRDQMRSLFFYQKLTQSEKTQIKRVFNLGGNEEIDNQEETKMEHPQIQSQQIIASNSSIFRAREMPQNVIVEEFKEFQNEVRGEVFRMKQSLSQMQNGIDGIMNRISQPRGGRRGRGGRGGTQSRNNYRMEEENSVSNNEGKSKS